MRKGVSVYSPVNPTPSREGTTVRYQLDPAVSRFRAQGYASGLLAPFGHNPRISISNFWGEVSLDSESIEQSSLRFTVDSSSFEVENDVSLKDRNDILRIMHNEVLETDKYPQIHYESSSVSARIVGAGRFWVVLGGNLSLHGVTCPQKIVASLVVNADTCRASGDFSIRQSDHDIRLYSAAGGTLRVKDEVKCTFDIVARKAD